jgi:hypothetical protein
MTSHRTITSTVALVALLSGATPAVALAGPLLSGYGNSGQGSQAILGSALLNGGGGGGSTGGGGGSAQGGGRSQSGAGSGAASSTTAAGRSTRSTAPSVRRGRTGAGGGRQGATPVPGSSAQAPSAYPSHEGSAGQSSGPLGLSGVDILYVVLALGALIMTAMFTRRLQQHPLGEGMGS